MKKRILCALLTLTMLLSLVPMTASAASRSVSESAITIIKQFQPYQKGCSEGGYVGYGTKCPEKGTHGPEGNHKGLEQNAADKALREYLKAVDKAVNDFADANKLSLSQNQHDALVMFSTQNGTAWLSGSGSVKRAVTSQLKGTDFLRAMVEWDANEADNNRRMVEANMYLYNVYNSTPPSRFIKVTFDPNGGSMKENPVQYFDLTKAQNINIIPTHSDSTKTFAGWHLSDGDSQDRITKVGPEHNGKTLVATWLNEDGNAYSFTVSSSEITKKGLYLNGPYEPGSFVSNQWVEGKVTCEQDMIYDGYRWGKVVAADVLKYNNGKNYFKPFNVTPGAGYDNCWVRLGKYSGPSADYDDNVIAVAKVTAAGYVNVRKGAGTNNDIVGSLPNGTEVNLYEIKYVNGIRWGRCNTGWFCLSYADVTMLKDEPNTSKDPGFTSYAFSGSDSVNNMIGRIYKDSNLTQQFARDDLNAINEKRKKDKKEELKADEVVTLTYTNLFTADGTRAKVSWGSVALGWVQLADTVGNFKVNLDVAKYTVTADSVAVRQEANVSSTRVDTLSKGVEFNVSRLKADSTTIWGYADKADGGNYGGWVNLSSTYVKRGNAPDVPSGGHQGTGLVATVINTDKVNVRDRADIYGKYLGQLDAGTTAEVLDKKNGWYRLNTSVGQNAGENWVYGTYLDVREGSVDDNGTGANGGKVETGNGIIANTYGGVNLRKSPGISGALIGKILPGIPVKILETKVVGNAKWGRVENGWICMDYVAMTSYEEIPGNGGSSGSGSGSSGGSVIDSKPVVFTGRVTTETKIYRSTTAKDEEIVGTIASGNPVTIHELLSTVETIKSETNPDGTTSVTKKTYYWARVNDGYILSPDTCVELDPMSEPTYTLTASDSQKVYTDETMSAKAFTLRKGDQVTVTKVKIDKADVLAMVEFEDEAGWILLSKLTKGAIDIEESKPTEPGNPTDPTNPSNPSGPVNGSQGNTGVRRYSGKVINTNELNVRSTASQTASKTTTLKGGQALVIYETTISEGMAWGRCDAGWIYLYYVDLTPVGTTAVDARVVYQDNTPIYTDASCSQAAGTYVKMAVIDIYEVVGKMARTDLGWVSTDNLL